MDEQFWSMVEKSEGCWVWRGCVHQKTGYGMLKRDRKRWLAHRFAYTDAVGPIPQGLVVRHKCDNRPCCNPAHLEIGTQKDNIRDAIERGRTRYLSGDSNPGSKLSEAQRAEIRNVPKSVTNSALARKYGVSVTQIGAHRGRAEHAPRGTSHHLSPFTPEQVREIRHSSARTCDLMAQFNVSRNTITHIRSGKTYRSVV